MFEGRLYNRKINISILKSSQTKNKKYCSVKTLGLGIKIRPFKDLNTSPREKANVAKINC